MSGIFLVIKALERIISSVYLQAILAIEIAYNSFKPRYITHIHITYLWPRSGILIANLVIDHIKPPYQHSLGFKRSYSRVT